jgi:CTP synthase (UTP-ammonia lyase)
VQVIPHVTNEIKAAIRKVSADVDVVIVEIGGTVGDIESLPFLEAIRQMRHEVGRENAVFVHVTLVPWIAAAKEMKTKPTQHSVKELRAIGIQPDMLLCRTDRSLSRDLKEKIALFCDVDVAAVISARDVASVYEVPLVFAEQGVDEIILRAFRLEAGPRDLACWTAMLERLKNPADEVNIAICLGMQTMVIEFARHVCGLERADSTEFEPAAAHRVIYKLRELKGVDELGGTMRLGAYNCLLAEGSFAHRAYGARKISERHRHRYEFNRDYEPVLTAAGLRIAGQTPDGVYVEICELPDHPWALACQFHPEFKSKPLEPHPLFRAFIGAAYEYRQRRLHAEAASRAPEVVSAGVAGS